MGMHPHSNIDLTAMVRRRLPSQKHAVYITPAGAERLRQELAFLWRDKRPKVTQAVSDAAAQGDRSENAEYIYGKKQLREIDRRIRYLQKRLDDLVIVDRVPDDRSRIFFGATVKLEDDNGRIVQYRIVGPDELDLKKGYISIDSPLACALLKKSVDDEVRLRIGDVETLYTVIAIRYDVPPAST